MKTQYGIPLVVGDLGSGAAAQGLKRLSLNETGTYNERWLQTIIMKHPGLLPVSEIEPAFTPPIPICTELNVPSGRVDNLYVTPLGDLIIGETKLYRNQEARREVVAQVLDYAKDLASWDYEQLDTAVRKAQASEFIHKSGTSGLYAAVAEAVGAEALEEARFVDAVSRNLRRGRFLLLVIGDGIQEGVESLARFLQDHAQLHFTFALVEVSIFELPKQTERSQGYLVQPRIIARTFNVERGTYILADEKISFAPVKKTPGPQSGRKLTTLSEEEFYEKLERELPGVKSKLSDFIARLEALGVQANLSSAALNLHWSPDDRRVWSLGSIYRNGKLSLEALNSQTEQLGMLDKAHEYIEKIVQLVPGSSVKNRERPLLWYVAKDGTYVFIDDVLLNGDGWFQAIAEFVNAVTRALSNQ